MEPKALLEQFYSMSGIPLTWADLNGEYLHFGADPFSVPYEQEILALFQAREAALAYHITGEYLFYGYLYLASHKEMILIGPASVGEERRRLYLGLSAVAPSVDPAFLRAYCRTVPSMQPNDFLTNLQFLYHALCREKLMTKKLEPVYVGARQSAAQADHSQSLNGKTDRDMDRMILSWIEHGKVEELKKNLRHNVQKRPAPEYYGVETLRSMKNVMISATTLFARAAIYGHMDYAAALQSSDVFIQEIEKLQTLKEVSEMFYKVALYYAQQTAAVQRTPAATPLIRKMTSFILAHLREKLTVERLAKELGQNPSYLSRHFKDQTGETISGYITKTRLAEAKRLLRDSQLTLVEIADRTGFSSQQHFQSVFKKNEGVTPGKFRVGVYGL